MPITKLLILGVVIGSNNLAAALALGALGQAKQRWRVILVFGVFEFFIPLIGIWLGQQVSGWIANNAGWIGSLLLLILGLWSIQTGFRKKSSGEELAKKATSWGGLFLLATGLSLDNLIVGFSLGLKDTKPLIVATTIAIFSIGFTWAGMKLGGKARKHWQRYAELGAGALLVALAVANWQGWI